MAAFLLLLGARERRRTGVRSTRATLAEVHVALDAYRADHDKKCPPSLSALTAEGYLAIEGTKSGEPPLDAWGRPFRLTCPGRKDPDGYDLMSEGPDGEVGALSRVE
jgi:general secretion pathway protein G